jgi:exosome complex RNA-binding protein Csl4
MSRYSRSDRRDVEADVLVAIYERVGERIQLNDLANELHMDENELRTIIISLSPKTTVKLSFDRNSGELLIGVPTTEGVVPSYCANCNQPLPEGAHYCPSCGNAVIER